MSHQVNREDSIYLEVCNEEVNFKGGHPKLDLYIVLDRVSPCGVINIGFFRFDK